MKLTFKIAEDAVLVAEESTGSYLVSIDSVQGGLDLRDPDTLYGDNQLKWMVSAYISVVQGCLEKLDNEANSALLERVYDDEDEEGREDILEALPPKARDDLLIFWAIKKKTIPIWRDKWRN